MKPPFRVNDYLIIILIQVKEKGFAVHLLFFAIPLVMNKRINACGILRCLFYNV